MAAIARSYIFGLLAAATFYVGSGGRLQSDVSEESSAGSLILDVDLAESEGPTESEKSSNDFSKGIFKAVELSASMTKNCLPDMIESLQTLQKACASAPRSASSLTEMTPVLDALKGAAEILKRSDCLEDSSKPLPTELANAIDFISSSTGAALFSSAAVEETRAFVKSSGDHIRRKCYHCVGEDAGSLLLSLASQAGTVPMLEGLASSLEGAETQVAKLNDWNAKLRGCQEAADAGWQLVRSMRTHLSPPKRRLGIFPAGPKAFVKQLDGLGELVHNAESVLDKCLPERVAASGRVDGFKAALQMAGDVIHSGQDLILMGVDVVKELGAMRASAEAGDWKSVGTNIGNIVTIMNSGHSGVAAIGDFVRQVTGASGSGDSTIHEIKVCMQGSRTFIDTCKVTFVPLSSQSPLDESREGLQRLSELLSTAQGSLDDCKQIGGRSLGRLMKPEIRLMGAAMQTLLDKASHDTSRLISAADKVKEVEDAFKEASEVYNASLEVAVALNSQRYGQASEHMAEVLRHINDNVNANSFLSGLLQALGEEAESLPTCIGDVSRIMSSLRDAAYAMELSPRKWSIDKGDCDRAMAALHAAVEATHDMLSSCRKQIEALQALLKALMRKQWEKAADKVNMFRENVAEPILQLVKAVSDRDWVKVGQVIADLALKALKYAESQALT